MIVMFVDFVIATGDEVRMDVGQELHITHQDEGPTIYLSS